MSQPIRGQGGHLVFPIGPKNTNLVDDVDILLPVKFRWVPFSGFGEVKNVSANQKPGRPSCFSDRPKKHKLGRRRWHLVSVKFRWIPFSGFRGEVENVSANQKPGWPSCFSDRPSKVSRAITFAKFAEYELSSYMNISTLWCYISVKFHLNPCNNVGDVKKTSKHVSKSRCQEILLLQNLLNLNYLPTCTSRLVVENMYICLYSFIQICERM